MRRCRVSMYGKDGNLHSVETDAESLFDAAYEAVRLWGRLWFYSSDFVIEVQSGEERWYVDARRVARWYGDGFDKGRLPPKDHLR